MRRNARYAISATALVALIGLWTPAVLATSRGDGDTQPPNPAASEQSNSPEIGPTPSASALASPSESSSPSPQTSATASASPSTPTGSPAASSPPASNDLPPYAVWQADVTAVMRDANAYLDSRATQSMANTAIVLDIDNTALSTTYGPSYHSYQYAANPPVFALALRAHEMGVAIMFVTGRPESYRSLTQTNLTTVGYPIDTLVMRPSSAIPLGQYKTAARANIEARGYTIIANIGNNTTDVEGGHAERAYKLPDYNGKLA